MLGLVLGEGALHIDGAVQRPSRTGEGEHEAIALVLHFEASVLLEDPAKKLIVLPEQLPGALVAKLLDQRRGALDVGEEDRHGPLRRTSRPCEPLHEAAHDLRMEERIAAMHRADRVRELFGLHVLHQVARRAGLQRREELIVVREAGQDEHLRLRTALLHTADGGDAVKAGHHQIHQHDLRLDLRGLLDRLDAVSRFCDDGDIVLQVEEEAEAVAHHSLVVHDEHPDLLSQPAAPDGSWYPHQGTTRSPASRPRPRPAPALTSGRGVSSASARPPARTRRRRR